MPVWAFVAVGLTAAAGSGVARADQFSPAPGSPFPAGSQPGALALGDFNGDGSLDIAAANRDASTVTELLGYQNGEFAPLATVPVGSSPGGVASADFNGDGLNDVAVTDTGDNDVRVLLATPSGYLNPAPGAPIPVGVLPGSIAAADLTGAGTPDLVVANYGSGTVSVLLGDGTGQFSPAPGSPQLVGTPIALAIADFNLDGIPDLAVVDQFDNSVTVLLGTGTGDFRPAASQPIPVGASPIAIKAADFNGDGIPDLAVANRSDGTVSVLLGNGDGTFTQAAGSPVPIGGAISALAVGDFNVDGIPDLAIADSQANAVSLQFGNGDGTFSAAPDGGVPVGTDPEALLVGSFGSASPDLAVGNFADGTLSVLLNNAAGTAPCDACDPPILGETVNLAPVSGRVFVKLPRRGHGHRMRGTRFVPLMSQRQLPVGTIVNATHGNVRLSAARGRQGAVQTAQLGGTTFEILQRRQDRGLTNLQLVGTPSNRLCTAAGSRTATAASSSRVLALLHASAHGSFRTSTKYSAATVRGTQWDTVLRCDGTLTRVQRGVVVVQDFRLRRSVIVRAGHSYLARR